VVRFVNHLKLSVVFLETGLDSLVLLLGEGPWSNLNELGRLNWFFFVLFPFFRKGQLCMDWEVFNQIFLLVDLHDELVLGLVRDLRVAIVSDVVKLYGY
jgi:hypothetical protein